MVANGELIRGYLSAVELRSTALADFGARLESPRRDQLPAGFTGTATPLLFHFHTTKVSGLSPVLLTP